MRPSSLEDTNRTELKDASWANSTDRRTSRTVDIVDGLW